MNQPSYEEVLDQVQHLTPDDQLRLAEELMVIVRQQGKGPRKHHVMEFRGMDKKTWAGIDVEKYINEERNSWER